MELPPEPDPRHSGTARLLGGAGLARLQASRVMIIGIGGVGSWTAEALARAGVGHLHLIDLDEICVSNVNRQIHATDATVGQMKVEAMAERIRSFAPDTEVKADLRFFTDQSCAEILETEPDVVVDCIDSIPHKCLLLSECRRRGLRVVTVGAAGGRGDPTQVMCVDLTRTYRDALLQRVRKKLRQKFDFPRNTRKKWGIPAVFSPEAPVFPQSDGSVCDTREEGSQLKLDCASGYGTVGYVTGTFGFAAAHAAVALLTHTE
jgi:tRNA A37 threonylcarbamoyladenosine dehydratase